MTTSKKPSSKRPPAANWSSSGSPHELQGADLVAHGILATRSDLLPSVARIMNSDLDADERLRAINLFKDALDTPGDVCRDPRVAIEQCVRDRPGGGTR